jgi:crotonobetaine/carnitine-CoA ligase
MPLKEYAYEERTVGYILEDKARKIGGKTFFVDKDVTVTYGEMDANANRVANSLIEMGVEKSDKVCVIMANSVDFLYTWFALAKIGAVMVPINHALKGKLLSYTISNSDASVVIVDGDLADRVAFVQEDYHSGHVGCAILRPF